MKITGKHIAIIAVTIAFISVLFASNKDYNGNGELTQEVAQKWGNKFCGSQVQVQKVENTKEETGGFIVKCNEEFTATVEGGILMDSDKFKLTYADVLPFYITAE
jgi:hypothetical protein